MSTNQLDGRRYSGRVKLDPDGVNSSVFHLLNPVGSGRIVGVARIRLSNPNVNAQAVGGRFAVGYGFAANGTGADVGVMTDASGSALTVAGSYTQGGFGMDYRIGQPPALGDSLAKLFGVQAAFTYNELDRIEMDGSLDVLKDEDIALSDYPFILAPGIGLAVKFVDAGMGGRVNFFWNEWAA